MFLSLYTKHAGTLLTIMLATSISIAPANEAKPSSVHELNPEIMAMFEQIAHQLAQLQKQAENSNNIKLLAQILMLQELLTKLKKEYSYTSPAMIFLGPLGAAAIVLKEQKLEQELKDIAHKAYLLTTDLQITSH